MRQAPLTYEDEELAKTLAALDAGSKARTNGRRARVARSYVTHVVEGGRSLVKFTLQSSIVLAQPWTLSGVPHLP